MVNSYKKILVFDSGIGGLSIAKHLLKQITQIELTYAFDNAAFPYGSKNSHWLLNRILTFTQKAMTLSEADLLIVACNTASTLALGQLREKFKLPIIGVVPAIKPGVNISHSKEIILLATPNTASSEYTRNLIDQFAKGAKVHLIGNALLVEEAEKLMSGKDLDYRVIDKVICEITAHKNADTIVLACTHYPFLRNIFIARMAQNSIKKYNWIDSSEAILNRTRNLLKLELNDNKLKNISEIQLLNSPFASAKKILTSAEIKNLQLRKNLTELGFSVFENMNIACEIVEN